MELWDLYDAEGNKTGETMWRGEPIPDGRYHLVVHIAIFSPDGRMLIQQRQPFKPGWSNLWDVTVGGSAVAGDDSRTAAMREVREKIGLTLDLHSVRPKLTFYTPTCINDWYLLTMDIDPASLTLQASEVQAVRWATQAEIQRMIAEKTFIPYEAGMISLLFHLHNHPDTRTRADDTVAG